MGPVCSRGKHAHFKVQNEPKLGIVNEFFVILNFQNTMAEKFHIIKVVKILQKLDSLAEWSKAPDLGSGPKGRGFKSHSCQFFLHIILIFPKPKLFTLLFLILIFP